MFCKLLKKKKKNLSLKNYLDKSRMTRFGIGAKIRDERIANLQTTIFL